MRSTFSKLKLKMAISTINDQPELEGDTFFNSSGDIIEFNHQYYFKNISYEKYTTYSGSRYYVIHCK